MSPRRKSSQSKPTGPGGTGTDPQEEAAERYTIGELAADLGITTRAIRFYESKGLVAPARKGVARAYTRRDRGRLMLILRGKNLGFTLEDIGAYLELYDADPSQLSQLKLLQEKVDAHIAALESKRADIERTLGELQEIRGQVMAALAGKGGSHG